MFDQFAGKSIKGRTTRIGRIDDDLFSVLKNGFMVLDFPLWRCYPLSMLFACMIWLLPVASVIIPATLNVHLTSFSNWNFTSELPLGVSSACSPQIEGLVSFSLDSSFGFFGSSIVDTFMVDRKSVV